MSRTSLGTVLLLASGGGIPVSLAAQEQVPPLRTQGERSEFAQLTAYDSMMVFLRAVDLSTSEMRLDSYGVSNEGRALPYAILSRSAGLGPEEARALGKPVVVLAAGVHGGETTLRESLLILTRELSRPRSETNRLLDDLIIIVVPQMNPDGFANPEGPTRENALGADLNRDYMKLEHPETQSFVQNILLRWNPDLVVDGHDGGAFPANLNYLCSTHPEIFPPLPELCRSEILPAIDAKLAEAGFVAGPYSEVKLADGLPVESGGPEPRIGRNYDGLTNRVAVLFESPPGHPAADRIRSGALALRAVLEWAREDADLLLSTVAEARRETIAMGGAPGSVIALVAEEYETPVVDRFTRARPWGYLIPPEAQDVVDLLRRHGIEVEELSERTRVQALAYTIEEVVREAAYDHPAAVRLTVGETVVREWDHPPGTILVRTAQPLGRVAALLLEPESRDGVAYWNRLDELLPFGEVEEFRAGRGDPPLFPILKVMEPTVLPIHPRR